MFDFAQLIVLIIALAYTVFTNQPLWGIVIAILMLCVALGGLHDRK